MENIWTDRNELDRINEQFDEEYDQLKTTINSIKEAVPSLRIGNYGLYAGNKMRSLYRRYKENDVNYVDSKINRALETYFMLQFADTVYAIKRFAHKMQKKLGNYTNLDTMRKFVLSSPDIEEYIKICESVYEFDLDKDVVPALNYVLDETPVFLGIDINELIEEYNEELERLKVSQKIEYRDPETITSEIPEDELMFLKFIVDEISKQLPMDDMDFIESPEQQEKELQKIIRRNNETNKE